MSLIGSWPSFQTTSLTIPIDPFTKPFSTQILSVNMTLAPKQMQSWGSNPSASSSFAPSAPRPVCVDLILRIGTVWCSSVRPFHQLDAHMPNWTSNSYNICQLDVQFICHCLVYIYTENSPLLN